MSVFSDKIKLLRLEHNKKQSDIAKMLGVSVQSYSAYESGREPNYDLLYKLAKYFNTTVDYLLGLSPNKTLDNIDIGKRFGLSDKAIDRLEKKNFDSKTINAFIENDNFENLVDNLFFYISSDNNSFSKLLDQSTPAEKGKEKDGIERFKLTLLQQGFETFSLNSIKSIIENIAITMRKKYEKEKRESDEKIAPYI